MDGRVIAKLSDGGGSTALKDLGLTAGSHEVSVGNQRQKFLVCEPGYRPSGRPVREILGYEIRGDGSQFFACSLGVTSVSDVTEQPGRVYVVGASVLGLPEGASLLVRQKVTLPPGYQRYVILGRRPGEVLEVKGQSLLKHGTNSKDVTVPYEPQWLIKVGRKHKFFLSSLDKLRLPENTIADRGSLGLWVQWVTAPHMKVEQRRESLIFWKAYQGLAAEIAGGCS